jgi:thymidine kinase
MANIHFIYGPVKSSKTTELLTLYDLLKHSSIILCNIIDNRYESGFITNHQGQRAPAIIYDNNLLEIYEKYKPQNIFIDEIQFFGINFVEQLAALKCNIYCAGLNADFRGEQFETSKKLFEIVPAENLYQKKGLCACGAFATQSKLIADKKIEGSVLVGNYFICTCVSCH